MDLELITIGTELLLGFTLDTNGGEIARGVAALGVRIRRRTSVPDEATAISDAVREALRRTGAVLTTGGLGPTSDDITKKTVADLFGAALEFQEPLWEALVERFARLGRVPSATNRCQAEVPQGAQILENRWGTAPGLWLEGEPGLVIMLPGVPREMRNLLVHEVLPRLAKRVGPTVVRSRTLRTTGIPESRLAERLDPIGADLAPLTLAYLPSLAGVDLRVTAWNLSPADAETRLAAALERLRAQVGEAAYGAGEDDLAAIVLNTLGKMGMRLAVAESCTGGMLGSRLTAIPGSSAVFVGGVIAYDNSVKTSELDISPSLLAEAGAVSEPVARRMAEAVRQKLGAEVGVAVTGIAGPSGGTADKPVGTIWFGMALTERTESWMTVLPGDREEIRARAVQGALFRLYRSLRGKA